MGVTEPDAPEDQWGQWKLGTTCSAAGPAVKTVLADCCHEEVGPWVARFTVGFFFPGELEFSETSQILNTGTKNKRPFNTMGQAGSHCGQNVT